MMSLRVPRWFALPLVLSGCWAGCGSSDDGDSGPGQQGTGGSGGSTSSIPCDATDTLDLDGTFALSAKLTFDFASQPGGAVTVCPTDQVSEGTFLGLVQIRHAPGSDQIESMSAVVCTLELPVVSAIVGDCDPTASNLVYAGLEFPQALVDAFPLAVTANTTAQLTGLAPGATVTPGALDFFIGMTSDATQAPTWDMEAPGCGMNDNDVGRSQQCEESCVTDCAATEDDDGDGWPGVTVHVCGYTEEDQEQNVACNAQTPNVAGTTIQGRAMMNLQVTPLVLAGQAASSCEVAGLVDASMTYNVIGADLYLANTQISVTSAIKSLPTYQVDPSQSRFRLVRVDGKHGAPDWNADFADPLGTCRTIITKQNELL